MKNIIKIVLSFISIVILTVFFNKIAFADLRPVVDNANLLTNQEINYLTEEIESFKLKYNMDAVIVTINNLEGESPQNYADNYYDYNGYGLGNEESGLILLIDMDTRKIYISTCCFQVETGGNKKSPLLKGDYYARYKKVSFTLRRK